MVERWYQLDPTAAGVCSAIKRRYPRPIFVCRGWRRRFDRSIGICAGFEPERLDETYKRIVGRTVLVVRAVACARPGDDCFHEFRIENARDRPDHDGQLLQRTVRLRAPN